MQATDHARTTRRVGTLVIAVSTLVASIALAGVPRPPSCLSFDDSSSDPTGTCCDSTPTAYNDENGSPGNGTVIGDLLTRPDTFHSVGFVWDIDGDADHDGSVSVRYRKAGACKFKPAMSLVRNDYAWFWNGAQAAEPANNFAGSLMFLTPGTAYEVVLELNDPDGGRAIRVEELRTRAIPRKPTSGRTHYVVPGSGGGDGSDANPFRGIDAANAAALPGDRMLLRDGTYSRATLSASGADDNHIVWEPDEDASPVVAALAITGDHIWIDQLTFEWNDPTNGTIYIEDQHWSDTSGIYVPSSATSPDDVVITNSTFTGFINGIISWYALSRWTAMDNTIVGWRPVGTGGLPQNSVSTGKGIALGGENTPGGPGCVIAYNSITRFTDGIGINEDGDVYGNQVWDIAGNAASSDGAWANVRIWGNRFMYTAGSPITFQPQKSGPWYFLYNQMGQARSGVFKFRTLDRAVFINNTFLSGELQGQYFMKFFTRNNLFIDENAPIWNSIDNSDNDPLWHNVPQYTADWNTDIDFDGFDRGGSGAFFNWFDNTASFTTLASWTAAVGGGAEANAIEVDADLIFADYTLSPTNSLELASGTNAAVDAGQAVNNLADFYLGAAPDLGAHERGAMAIPYGPRASGTPLDRHTLYWAKH